MTQSQPPTNGRVSVWKLQFNLTAVIQIIGLVIFLSAGLWRIDKKFDALERTIEINMSDRWSKTDDAQYMYRYSHRNNLNCPPHLRVDEWDTWAEHPSIEAKGESDHGTN